MSERNSQQPSMTASPTSDIKQDLSTVFPATNSQQASMTTSPTSNTKQDLSTIFPATNSQQPSMTASPASVTKQDLSEDFPATSGSTFPAAREVFRPTYPSDEEQVNVRRGHLIIVSRTNEAEPHLYVVHHVEAQHETAPVDIYGFDVRNLIDLEHCYCYCENDFVRRFRNEPQPAMAVLALRKEALIPTMDYNDSANISPSRIAFSKDDHVWLEPHAGAVRNFLLGRCPLDCFFGDFWRTSERSYDEFDRKFPGFLNALSESTRKLAEQKLNTAPQKIPCPCCHGYELVREELGREAAHIEHGKESSPNPLATNMLWDRSRKSLKALNEARYQMGYELLRYVRTQTDGDEELSGELEVGTELLDSLSEEDKLLAASLAARPLEEDCCPTCGHEMKDEITCGWERSPFVHKGRLGGGQKCPECEAKKAECDTNDSGFA